jgi:Concanavalin A-like lectin/glucanases superfamily/Domain of unknown function (DUF2341)
MIYDAKSDINGTISPFKYRKKLTINHSGALTSYQVRLTVDHVNTNMKTDFGDIRFNTDTGNYIPYWIEKQVNDISADVWIKTDLANGNTIIYMYYGNQSLVGAINVTDTFIREISGVVGAWDLNGDALDRSGQGNNGTLIGGMGYSTGKFYSGGNFDGSDDFIVIPSTFPMLGTTWTISMWIYPRSYGATYNTLYSRVSDDGWLQIFLNGSGQVKIAANIEGEQTYTGASVSLNTWTLVQIVSISKSTTVYLNGISAGTKTVTSPPTGIIMIGWDTNPTGRQFNGIIERLCIYNMSLLSDERANLQNNIGYTTINYPGKELIRKYVTIDPTVTTGAEQTITATHMSIVPRESPCRVGICIVDVHVTWTNTGESTMFTPSITVDGTTHSLAPRTLPIDDTIIDFEVSGMNTATHTICPDPN